MSEPLIFDKHDWLEQCRKLFPHLSYSERYQFWLDCENAEKANAEKRQAQAPRPQD